MVRKLEDTSHLTADEVSEIAQRLHEAGDMVSAERFLEALTVRSDAVPGDFHNLGTVRVLLDDFAGAVQAYSRSVGEVPEGFANRGLAYERLGLLQEARSDYRRALELDPADETTLVNLGTMQLAAGEVDEAERTLSRAAEIDPTAHWALSDVYRAQGRLLLAKRSLELALAAGEARAAAELEEVEELLSGDAAD
jgi:tetratricopeptide (TPR) repeat protein